MGSPKKGASNQSAHSSATITEISGRLIRAGLMPLISRICRESFVDFRDVIGRRRSKRVVVARHQCILKLRGMGFSTTEIGMFLGLDHSSVCSALKRLRNVEPPASPQDDVHRT